MCILAHILFANLIFGGECMGTLDHMQLFIPVICRGVSTCSPTCSAELSHIAGVRVYWHLCYFQAWSYGVVYGHFSLHVIPEIGLYARIDEHIFHMPCLSQSYVRVNGHIGALYESG